MKYRVCTVLYCTAQYLYVVQQNLIFCTSVVDRITHNLFVFLFICPFVAAFRIIIIVMHGHCFLSSIFSLETVETNFHTFEDVCHGCSILRKPDPTLPACPTPACDGTSGSNAFQTLLEQNCVSNCASTMCADNYRILRAEHDACEGEVLTTTAENGLHDHEEICEPYNCNILTTPEDVAAQLVCTEDGHGKENAPTNAPPGSAAAPVWTMAVCWTSLLLLLGPAVMAMQIMG